MKEVDQLKYKYKLHPILITLMIRFLMIYLLRLKKQKKFFLLYNNNKY